MFFSGNPTFESLSKQEKGPCTLAEKFYMNDAGYLLSLFDTNQKSIEEEIEIYVGSRYESSNLTLSQLINIDLSEYGYHK